MYEFQWFLHLGRNETKQKKLLAFLLKYESPCHCSLLFGEWLFCIVIKFSQTSNQLTLVISHDSSLLSLLTLPPGGGNAMVEVIWTLSYSFNMIYLMKLFLFIYGDDIYGIGILVLVLKTRLSYTVLKSFKIIIMVHIYWLIFIKDNAL